MNKLCFDEEKNLGLKFYRLIPIIFKFFKVPKPQNILLPFPLKK